MRLLNSCFIGFCAVLAVCRPAGAQVGEDNVAATFHFAGGAHLAEEADFANVKKIFTLGSSVEFRGLVMNRFSEWLAASLPFPPNAQTPAILRPLLDDLVTSESMGGFGGATRGPLGFILALQLNDQRAQAWQDALRRAFGTSGKDVKTGNVTVQRWEHGGRSLWTMRAKDWLLVGSGDDLEALRKEYLQGLTEHGRPGPALSQSWLEADLDWPRLVHWMPDASFPFTPARTKVTMTTKAGSLRMATRIFYPAPIPWKFTPWRVPVELIRDPLISFTAGQDLAAFLKPDELLSPLKDNPLTGELYIWALGEMGFQSYATWPVADAAAALQRINLEAPAAFNPDLNRIHAGQLVVGQNGRMLVWAKLSPILGPYLRVAPATNGEYLLAGLFPLEKKNKPAPDALFQQIRGRDNLVYYDWEGTGRRLEQWRLLSGILPVLTTAPPRPQPGVSINGVPVRRTKSPLVIEENWLTGVTPLLNDTDSVTEITRTAPNELAVARKSPLGVTALELVVISHWLSGTGSPGVNPGLLPPPAKITGPGRPPKSP